MSDVYFVSYAKEKIHLAQSAHDRNHELCVSEIKILSYVRFTIGAWRSL